MNTTPKKFVLSKLSLGRLNGVDANLVKVVQRAIEITPQDFMVVEGVRTKEQCYINYGKGRTVGTAFKSYSVYIVCDHCWSVDWLMSWNTSR